jgi:hypothetical protein
LSLEVLEPRLLMASSPRYSGDLYLGSETPSQTDRPFPALGPSAEVAPGPVAANVTDGQGSLSTNYNSDPPSPAPYVVVPETSDFHGTPDTAQQIPYVPYAGVAGMLLPGEAIDLYQVQLGPETLALRLATADSQASVASTLRLWVFNAQGQVIAVGITSNGVVDLSVSSDQPGLAEGSTLYVGVDTPTPVVAPTGVGYQLWFLRLSGTEGSPNGSQGVGSAPQGEIIGGVALMPLASIPETLGKGMSSGVGVLTNSAPLASTQAPALAASQSGGVLTDSPQSLVLAMATRTVNDVERPEPLTHSAEPSPPSFEGRASQGDDTGASSPLVALRGPGGFPVLAAAAVGDWQQGRDAPQNPTGDDQRLALASSPDQDTSPAALPVIIAVAASSTRVNEPKDQAADSPGTGYATLATAYAFSVDHALFIDLAGNRPAVARPLLWPRGWRTRKRRRMECPRS